MCLHTLSNEEQEWYRLCTMVLIHASTHTAFASSFIVLYCGFWYNENRYKCHSARCDASTCLDCLMCLMVSVCKSCLSRMKKKWPPIPKHTHSHWLRNYSYLVHHSQKLTLGIACKIISMGRSVLPLWLLAGISGTNFLYFLHTSWSFVPTNEWFLPLN